MNINRKRCGRKPMTQNQRADYYDWETERTRIANLVSRCKTLDKICCICGKPGQILHNRYDPYMINFICPECRKQPDKLKLAEYGRFDVREYLEVKRIDKYSDEDVKRIVTGYLDKVCSIGDYCKEQKISRYHFNLLVERYDKIKPQLQVKELIKNRSHKVQKESCNKRMEDKNLQ